MKSAFSIKKPIALEAVQASEHLDFTLGSDAFGRLRREALWMLGYNRAHHFLTRFGFSCGEAEALRGEQDPHAVQKWGEIKTLNASPKDDEILIEVLNSGEARQALEFFTPSIQQTQCWFLEGYLSAVLSHELKQPVYFLETHCVAKNDARCVFVGRNRDSWMEKGLSDLHIFDEYNFDLELAQTKEQLRLTKDRFQNLFEQSSSPIFILNPDTGRCLNANVAAEELTGYTREELAQRNIFDLCDPREHYRLMNDLKSLAEGSRPKESELSIIRKDGSARTVASSIKILPYGDQRVIQWIMRDVTDLKHSEQKERDLQHQLVRSERLSHVGRLAASVAHELKNPLGAIRNAVYYIRNALKNNPLLETDPHLKEILKLAEEEIDGAVVIIGELLDFSRVVQLAPRKTQINDLLEKLPSVVSIPENIEVRWDLDLTLPSAQVDPDRLSQVFINITSNAVQAMAQGGKLTFKSQFVVESAEDGGSVQRVFVTIEDTGPGIEPIHLAKIFEPLFTTKARGTGLGLAISSNIIEKHGGVIQVNSQVGKGTSFTIKLPLNSPVEGEDKK